VNNGLLLGDALVRARGRGRLEGRQSAVIVQLHAARDLINRPTADRLQVLAIEQEALQVKPHSKPVPRQAATAAEA
jgi:hypothetical protein